MPTLVPNRVPTANKGAARAALTPVVDPDDPLGWKAIAEQQRLAGVPEFQPGYDPADPLNWKGIDAERQAARDKEGTPGSDWYDTPENDPEYVAWLEQYEYNKGKTNSDSDLRLGTAKADYEEALAELDRQGTSGARNIDVNMLQRGVLNSGETGMRRDELGAAIKLGRGKADTTLASVNGDIESDRLDALTQLDFDRENQIVASRARILAAEQLATEQAAAPAGGGGATQTYNPVDPGSNERQSVDALPYQARDQVDRGRDSTWYTKDMADDDKAATTAANRPKRNTATSLRPVPARRGGGSYVY